MSRWILEVEVDEDDLRISATESAEDGDTDDLSVKSMIEQEMGWVGQSGIHIVNLQELTDD